MIIKAKCFFDLARKCDIMAKSIILKIEETTTYMYPKTILIRMK